MFEKVKIGKGLKEEEQGQRVCNIALCSLNLEGGSSRSWQGRAGHRTWKIPDRRHHAIRGSKE